MNLFTPLEKISLTEMQEMLYPYTGPTVYAYGTRTKAVLENVGRSYQYYFNKENPTKDEVFNLKTGFKNEEDISMDNPSCGFDEKWVIFLSVNFVKKNKIALDKLNEWLGKTFYNIPYAELSKGRQTWSFIQNKNVPAAMALEETVKFLEINLKRKIGRSLLDFCKAVLEVFELDETIYLHEYKKQAWEEVEDENEDGELSYQTKAVTKECWQKFKFTRIQLYNHFRKLNSMWKHGERGKLQRRTIATASMLLRGFVKMVEEAAKVILQWVESSGIPVGGEEKLAKLASRLVVEEGDFSFEMSGDQEKWNECFDPDCMRLMWTIFLNEGVHCSQWVIDLFNFPFLVFKSKTAGMGEGLSYTSNFGETRNFRLGSKKSKFEFLERLIFEDDDESPFYDDINSRLGMFMGMFNFTSTLVALISVEAPWIIGKHVESSDDFIHFSYCQTSDEGKEQMELLRFLFKMVGINMSDKKTLVISPVGIGEFTSQYHNGPFVGNVATELPAIVPMGNNPTTDLTMGLNILKTAMGTLKMSPPVTNLLLKLFFRAYQYSYCSLGETFRTKFLRENNIPILLTNQGAKPVHSISTLHLDEVAFRLELGLLDNDTARKLLNPVNPISGLASDKITFRIESKRPQVLEEQGIGNLYSWSWTRNRTILNSSYKMLLEKEKKYQEICEIIEWTFPEVIIGIQGIQGSVLGALQGRLESMIEKADLTVEQRKELQNLLKK